jgi:hypothetical protein
MTDFLNWLAAVTLIIWLAVGIRVLATGYLIHMSGGTMNNTGSALNVKIDKVENFVGNKEQ